MARGSGRHLGGNGRRWWLPVRSSKPRQRRPADPQPPTVPFGLPTIPAITASADNTRWLLRKLNEDRRDAYDFITYKGFGHEFLEWRQQR